MENGNNQNSKLGYQTSLLERLSYGLYFFGQNLFYIIIAMFLLVFFTDVGIPAATVGIIALVVKIWDAVNDPIFGGFVDRTKFKNGKFLPWLKISLILIPLATIFLFAIPKTISLNMKVIWAVVGYILWDTAYTVCDVPIFGLVTTMTDNQEERTSIMSIGRVFGMAGVLIILVLVPTVRQRIGGWLPTAIVLSILGLVTMIPVCFLAKERVAPREGIEENISFKQMVDYVFKNKYLLIFFAALIIANTTTVGTSLGMYFARYCLKNEAVQGTLGLIGIFPSIVIGMLVPLLTKKFDKFSIYFGALIISVILNIISYFVGYSGSGFWVMVILKAVFAGFTTILMFMFTPDIAEYGTYKTGINASGLTFSFQTFTAKLISALSTAIAAFALSAIGFAEGEGAVQIASFENNLWMVYSLVPLIGMIIAIPIFAQYKLKDKDVQIMARSNAGEISKEEAEKLLGGRY